MLLLNVKMEEKNLNQIEQCKEDDMLKLARLAAVERLQLELLLSDKHKWERKHEELVDDNFYLEAYKKLWPCKLVEVVDEEVVQEWVEWDYESIKQFLKRTWYNEFIEIGFILCLKGNQIYKKCNYYLENDRWEKVLVKSWKLVPDRRECKSLLEFWPKEVEREKSIRTETKRWSMMWRSYEVEVEAITRLAYLKNDKWEYLLDDNGKRVVVWMRGD